MPWIRWCDTLNEEKKSLILNWWETTTTISPNTKDVKRRQIVVNTIENPPTHYLQESQVKAYQLSI
jgi:DNA polymerase sigma